MVSWENIFVLRKHTAEIFRGKRSTVPATYSQRVQERKPCVRINSKCGYGVTISASFLYVWNYFKIKGFLKIQLRNLKTPTQHILLDHLTGLSATHCGVTPPLWLLSPELYENILPTPSRFLLIFSEFLLPESQTRARFFKGLSNIEMSPCGDTCSAPPHALFVQPDSNAENTALIYPSKNYTSISARDWEAAGASRSPLIFRFGQKLGQLIREDNTVLFCHLSGIASSRWELVPFLQHRGLCRIYTAEGLLRGVQS